MDFGKTKDKPSAGRGTPQYMTCHRVLYEAQSARRKSIRQCTAVQQFSSDYWGTQAVERS